MKPSEQPLQQVGHPGCRPGCGRSSRVWRQRLVPAGTRSPGWSQPSRQGLGCGASAAAAEQQERCPWPQRILELYVYRHWNCCLIKAHLAAVVVMTILTAARAGTMKASLFGQLLAFLWGSVKTTLRHPYADHWLCSDCLLGALARGGTCMCPGIFQAAGFPSLPVPALREPSFQPERRFNRWFVFIIGFCISAFHSC